MAHSYSVLQNDKNSFLLCFNYDVARSTAKCWTDICRRNNNNTGLGYPFFTLGAHAQRGVVGSVCLLLNISLLRLTNDTTYLTANEGQNFRAVLSEDAQLQS